MGRVREVTKEPPGLFTRKKVFGATPRSTIRPMKGSKVVNGRVPRAGVAGEIILTPMARCVLEERYLRKDQNGRVIETPEEMWWRVASHVAQAERGYGCDPREWADRFFRIMANLEFLPNSPCLMNAGAGLGQLGACFVLPVKDSLSGIFKTLGQAALINKSGGGTGFSLSQLGPKEDGVATTGGVAMGPVRFMRVFNAASAEIKQGGRRQGANMAVLRVEHPDILDFITAKSETGVLEQFNISVAVTDEFMEKVISGDEYETINPRTGKPTGRLHARDVWAQIAEQAWKTGEPPVRNATRTTVAPTGTISIIAGTSSGIEPIFSIAYKRKALDREFLVFDPVFKEMAEAKGIYTHQLGEEIAANGSLSGIGGVPEDLRALFKTAYEISPEEHVRMQAAVQRYTDNAVSKTVNLPSNATADDVKKVFLLAFELGCKGITVFRQGSRTAVLSPGQQGRQYARMRERPKVTSGQSEKFETGCGTLYVHTTHDNKGLLEVFSNLGRGGGCPAQSEATARLVCLCLRCNVNPEEVVRQLEGMRCPTASRRRAEGKPVDVLSCPDAIAQALLRTMNRGEKKTLITGASEICPRCGGPRTPGRCGVCLACFEGGCDGA